MDESENLISPSNNKVGHVNENYVYQNYNAYLEYKESVLEHNFSLMAGTSYENEKKDKNEFTANSTISDIVLSVIGSDQLWVSEEYKKWGLASYFGRFNYDYQGKYLFEILGRYDGSSKFMPGYRWKGFYGVSGGYRISEENFIKELGIFNNLKLRASHGTTGNQAGIAVYDGIQFLGSSVASGFTANQPLFGEDGSTSFLPTITESSMVSTTRTWEIITTSNIGLDFSVLDNRLSGVLEYYWKKNDNMLIALTYPAQLGISAPATNNGTLKNKGWEVSLNWNDRIGDFRYGIGVNLSDNNNVLVAMENAKSIVGGYNKWVEGYALGTYWGFNTLGLITTEEQLEEYKKKLDSPNSISKHTLALGDMMYEDMSGDGFITAEDRVMLGEDAPHFLYGINFSLAYKGFDFSGFFQGVGKRTVMRDDYTRGPMLSWYMRQNDAWFGKQYSTIGADNYVVQNGLQDDYNPIQTGADLMPRLSSNDVTNTYN